MVEQRTRHEATCTFCAAAFMALKGQRFCCGSCKSKKATRRRKAENPEALAPPVRTIVRVEAACGVCGKTFLALKRQLYCRPACKVMAYYRRRRSAESGSLGSDLTVS